MLAKDILKGAVKVEDVGEAVLKECGNISARASNSQMTPRLEPPEKNGFAALAGKALAALPYGRY